MPAWALTETMAGGYRLDAAEDAHLDLPISLQIELHASSWRSLTRGQLELQGELDAGGFADHKTVSGTLRLRGRTLRYAFVFQDNQGEPFRFVERRMLRLGGLPSEMTVLRGRFEDARGRVVGRVLLRIDLRTQLSSWLRRR